MQIVLKRSAIFCPHLAGSSRAGILRTLSMPPKSPAKSLKRANAEEVGPAAADANTNAEQQLKAPAPSPSKSSPGKKASAAAPAAAPAPASKASTFKAAEEKPAPAAKAPAAKRAKKAPAEPEPTCAVYSESMRPPPPAAPHFKVLSWNVASLRALLKKDPKAITKLIEREHPDMICIQETKIAEKQVPEVTKLMALPAGWHTSWACSVDKAGYSGVGTLSKSAPLATSTGLGVNEHDGEGRLLLSEFDDFYVVNTYVPNSGEALARLGYRTSATGWDAALSDYVKNLQKRKPVLLVGDMNCAHQEIDIKNPKTNLKSAGFTPEERESFAARYLAPAPGGCELTDTFRKQYPDVVGYTYYSYRFNCRAKGIGWRLDYFLASKDLADKVHDTFLLSDVLGSDHVPLGVTILK